MRVRVPAVGIAARLTVLWTLLFAAGLAAFTALAWAGITREQYEALDADLAATATLASEKIAQGTVPTIQELQHADVPDAAVMVVRHGTRTSVGRNAVPTPIARQLALLPLNRGVTLAGNEAFRAYGIPLHSGGAGARVVALASTRTLQDEQRRSGYGFGIAAVPILLFAVVVGALLARRSLAPIANMRSVAAQIAQEGNLTRRLGMSGTDDLASLARTFNEMFDRLEQSFARERAFIGDVSHELRNSLGAIIGEADLALSKDDEIERYRRALRAIAMRARRLAAAAEDLLLLARADAGALPSGEIVDLNDIAARASAEVQQRSEGPAISLVLTEDAMPVRARSELLARAVENLLINARQSARAHVAVTLSSRTPFAELRVDDDGPGIPDAEREAIFRRFRRGAVTYAGSGLGLALVQAIVRVYGGSVAVERSDLGGASLWVRLPLAAEKMSSECHPVTVGSNRRSDTHEVF